MTAQDPEETDARAYYEGYKWPPPSQQVDIVSEWNQYQRDAFIFRLFHKLFQALAGSPIEERRNILKGPEPTSNWSDRVRPPRLDMPTTTTDVGGEVETP